MEDLRSLWNTEARYLLVDYILAVFPDDVREDDRPSVEKAVMAHVHTLQQAYLSSKSPQERRILVVRATRTQRKREVSGWSVSKRPKVDRIIFAETQ